VSGVPGGVCIETPVVSLLSAVPFRVPIDGVFIVSPLR
jgi:hypothetical protein